MLNPYQIRNAIRDDRYFFGRRRELDELMALVTASQPQSVAVIGDRRIGKSSLLQALYRRCRQNEGTVVAYQDVNGLGSSEAVLGALIDNLSVAGHLQGDGGPSLHSSLRRSISRLTERSRVVLLLDEFDALTGNEAFPITFFNFLRSLANEFPVAMVLAAKRKLKDICHSEEVAGSPFFNIFHERRLGCLTPPEAKNLIAEPSAQAGVPFEAYSADIVQWAGRWPLFIQILCYWLYETRKGSAEPGGHLATAKRQAADEVLLHLAKLWRHMSRTERRALSAVKAANATADIPQSVFDSLVARGLLEAAGDGYHRPAFDLLNTFLARPDSPCDCAVPARPANVRVFISYCHEDARLIERLGIITTLRDLEGDGFEVFSDTQLTTGDVWDDVLKRNLEDSRILVALVTEGYLRSRYCQDVEIRAFWEGRLKEGLVIFPIILSPCEWNRHQWLSSTQFLPRKGTVITDFKGPGKRQVLLLDAKKELRTVGERFREPLTPTH